LRVAENLSRRQVLALSRADIAWQLANQNKTTAAWTAWSFNKNRDPKPDAGAFMSAAGTSYAVLVLESRR